MRRARRVLICLVLLSSCSLMVPSDEDLLDHFEKHESEFLEMVEMLRVDGEVRHLRPGSVSPEGAIDTERWDSYKKIMRRAGVRSIHASWGNPQWLPDVEFSSRASRYNLEYDVGYAFSTREPEPLVEALAPAIEEIPPYAVWYRHIKGNWYIYLQNMGEGGRAQRPEGSE